MGKYIASTKLSPTLIIAEYTDGFWLYDETRGMNLSMRAKTSTDAFVEALGYYQRKLREVETAHRELTTKVDAFVSQFVENDNDQD